MDEPIYEVFARKKRGDALCHVGYLQAPDEELARIYAWKTYDEESWFEMCIIPRSAIVPVNRAGGGFATRQREAGASAEAGAGTSGGPGGDAGRGVAGESPDSGTGGRP